MYGSFINHIMGNSKNPTPEVGMGATILLYSDRNPATVVAVSKNGKTVTVQADKYVRIDRNYESEDQSYEYTPNPEAPHRVFTLRKNGCYVEKGQSMNGTGLSLGHRERYYDFTR